MYALTQWGDEAKIDAAENPVKELVALYVRFHEEADLDPDLEDAARAWFQRLESGDAEARRLWKKCIDWSQREYERIYQTLGVEFDLTLGESFYEPLLAGTIQEVESAGLLQKSNGAKIFDFEAQGLGKSIFVKSDGASIYLTRDVATALYRLRQMKAEKLVYVVGQEQKLHFQQLAAVLNGLGTSLHDNFQHVAFGHYRLPEGKMSTRAGKVVLLDEVIAQALEKSRLLVADRSNLENETEKQQLTEDLAIGALKWNDLKLDPSHSVIFDIDEVLSMEGNSAPYVMYTYARMHSVLSKQDEVLDLSQIAITGEEENSVINLLSVYPEKLQIVVSRNSPAVLVQYLYGLAQEYNKLYNALPILRAEPKQKMTRLALTMATASIIKSGLSLLGINAPERM